MSTVHVCIRPCMPRSVSVRACMYAFVHVSACICTYKCVVQGHDPQDFLGKYKTSLRLQSKVKLILTIVLQKLIMMIITYKQVHSVIIC